MLQQIINGQILTPSGWLEGGSVIVDGNKIVEVSNCDLPVVGAEIIDAKGGYIVPGGIELHVHGGGGRDFMEGEEEAFNVAVNAHLQHGTTAIYPTLSSSTIPMIEAALRVTEKLMEDPNTPIMGLHLEGHYFDLGKAGAQMPENIKKPDPNEYLPILQGTKVLKRWDAAPELPGAKEFFEACVKYGCKPCIGHTNGCWPDVKMAYEAGATHATHFTNAMSGLHKNREFKEAGVIESVYAIPDFTVEVIADGIHVPPVLMKMIYNCKGVERTCFITDSLACAASDSTENFDPRVIIEDGVCKLSDRSALAGSIATMDRLVRTAVQMADIPMADACRMISETPAKIMGIYDRKGSLERGKDADIIVFDADLALKFVMQMGRVAKYEL